MDSDPKLGLSRKKQPSVRAETNFSRSQRSEPEGLAAYRRSFGLRALRRTSARLRK